MPRQKSNIGQFQHDTKRMRVVHREQQLNNDNFVNDKDLWSSKDYSAMVDYKNGLSNFIENPILVCQFCSAL